MRIAPPILAVAACLLCPLPGRAAGSAPPPPDRAREILDLQFQSRATRPPPPGISGREADHVYEGMSGGANHGGSAAPAAPAAGMSGQ